MEKCPPNQNNFPRLTCPFCSKTFENRYTYTRHVGSVHEIVLECCKEDRLDLSSDESISPRNKAAEQRKRWIKPKKIQDHNINSRPDTQSTMPLSESRDR